MADSYQTIGVVIREARTARGWSQARLAREAGTTQQNVARIESGQVLYSRSLQPILAALGLDPIGLAPAPPRTPEIIPGEDIVSRDATMPIYAAAEGGDGAILVTFDPIDYVKWPAPLMHVRKGFGVIIIEESMVPVFEPGDIALVNPLVQPRRGKNGVFLGPEDSQTVRAVIKRYEGQNDAEWRVSQWNPQKNFTLARIDWPRVYAVVGKYDAR